MTDIQEFERTPVQPEKLEPARRFTASYAGEHVAGTEFVIGAMFVAWGVSTGEILWGLLWGNLLAVLTWGLICAPIAVQTRLTLYAYLEKIGGPGIIKFYSVVNGVLFCILAGAMVTVSASAVRILFGISPQIHWYPTSFTFVLIALGVGAAMVVVAIKGFHRVAVFAQVCAPWMILMFIVGALALLPVLLASTPAIEGLGLLESLKRTADTHIWQGGGTELSMWHVAAFAWICNLAMHGGLSDMTLLRFARKSSYGYLSFFGMFIGHYLAWVCAGVMGAGAALLLQSSITHLDAGEVAFQALGTAGIVAVIIAGWTTSNPTIYRAGLAFQSLNHRWSRVTVTAIAGVVTTIIACFPFVFTGLMEFVGIMGLALAPVGAVIVTEHWLFPRLGLTRYWVSYSGRNINWAAVAAWGGALLFALFLERSGVHLFFLLVPAWIAATLIYIALAAVIGARNDFTAQASAEINTDKDRRAREQQYLLATENQARQRIQVPTTVRNRILGAVALLSLLACLGMAIAVLMGTPLEFLRTWLILPSVIYFVAATLWAYGKAAHRA